MVEKRWRRFSREFKLEAVKLASQEGVAVSQIARDLGIQDTVLRHWKQQPKVKISMSSGVDMPL